MKNIRDRLAAICEYYNSTRQCGHTTAMMNGVHNTESVIVVAHNTDHANLLSEIAPNANCISSYCVHESLRGHHKPLLIDHYALTELLFDAIHEIDRLETTLERTAESWT